MDERIRYRDARGEGAGVERIARNHVRPWRRLPFASRAGQNQHIMAAHQQPLYHGSANIARASAHEHRCHILNVRMSRIATVLVLLATLMSAADNSASLAP